MVPNRARSSAQSASRRHIEPAMQPELSSPCWLILSRSLSPSPGITASPSCDPSSLSVSDAIYMLTVLCQILSSGSDSSEPANSTRWFRDGPGRACWDSTSPRSGSIALGSLPNARLPSWSTKDDLVSFLCDSSSSEIQPLLFSILSSFLLVGFHQHWRSNCTAFERWVQIGNHISCHDKYPHYSNTTPLISENIPSHLS